MTAQAPAALGYRMPAEWEPHAATWLSWPRREGISFPDSFDRVMPALRAMIEALIESEQVCINVCNDAHESEARDVLRGLPMERISFHSIPTNEPWCRDHGPVFLTRALATPVSGGQPLQVQPPERSNDTRGRGWAIQPVQGTGCPSGAERIDPKLAIVDWDYNAWGNKYPPFDLDEVVPTHLAQILNVPIFYPRMILEGGAIDVNGAG
ncbi:MAG: hypothetical protein DME39_01475, partial [Verrucomicrobia bacterium]